MNRFAPHALLLLVASAALPACSNNNTTTSPTAITLATVTLPEDGPGTVTQRGADGRPFIVGAAGTVTATLSTLSPDSAAIVGFSLGTWNGASCQIVLANDKATQGSVIIGATTSAGNLCVRVYDVGNITDPINWQVTVSHP